MKYKVHSIYQEIATCPAGIKRILKLRQGQSIVETLVALTVFVSGFMSILVLLNQSLGLNNVARDSYVASNLAAEGIEIVKNILDTALTQEELWSDITTSVVSDGCYEVEYSTTDLSTGALGSCIPSDVITNGTAQLLSIDSATSFYGYGSGRQVLYRRVVNIETVDPQQMKVTAVVGWESHRLTYEIQLEDRFYNWRPPR